MKKYVVSALLILLMVTNPLTGIVFAESEGRMNVSSVSKISGSLDTFTASVCAGVNQITVAGHDFKPGQGIAIKDAGTSSNTNGWLITEVANVDGNTITIADTPSNNVQFTTVQHDDTKAVNELILTSLGTIYFDIPTMYACGIELKSNINYDGMGMCKILCPVYRSTENNITPLINAKEKRNIKFSGFVIDGGKSRGVKGNSIFGVVLLLLDDVSDVIVENNTFQDNYYGSIMMHHKAKNVSIRNNKIFDTDVGVMGLPLWQGSLNLDNITIDNNEITGGTSEGISIESGMYVYQNGYANDVSILNNTIKNKASTAIVYGSRTSNSRVMGNTIENCLNGITTRDPALEPEQGFISKSNEIAGNTIRGIKYAGMLIDGYNTKISTNKFFDTDEALILGTLYTDDLEVSENKFENCSISVGHCIKLENSKNTVIKNNTFSSTKSDHLNSAIAIENNNIENALITGNTTSDNMRFTFGYYLSSIKDVKVMKNTVGNIVYLGYTISQLDSLDVTLVDNNLNTNLTLATR